MYFNRAEYRSYLAESRRFAEQLADPEALAAVEQEERALAAGGPPALLEQLRMQRTTRHARGSAGAYAVAQVESLLGRREQALSHLQEACARHEPLVMAMRIDPTLANLRNEPRYQELLVQLGLSASVPGGRRRRRPPLPHPPDHPAPRAPRAPLPLRD